MRLIRTGWTTALAIAVVANLLPSLAQGQSTTVRELVVRYAEQLSREPHRPPQPNPESARITYTDYMGIRVKPGKEIWSSEKIGFALHPMPLGGLHTTPVAIDVVDSNGAITRIETGPGFYEHILPKEHVPEDGNLGISGFRITSPLNSAKTLDELIVFQGASYFRALSKGQHYGLSARGLSIDTGQSRPEEFPGFRHFWIEKPEGPRKLVIHALLDSPSVTGAFIFQISPGAPTVIDVEAAIFPRQDLASAGIAPLTSMYFYSVGDGTTPAARDYRPAVHDSDGLLVANGKGELLWRPLRNPSAIRANSFADTRPKGFGLMQRQRDFSQYQDLEARYHRRPSAWIEPRGDWGAGSVELFELPTDSEYHDNIVAQWKPADPLRAGKRYDFAYRISWPDRTPDENIGALVNWTRSGPADLPSTPGKAIRFVIDYKLANDAATPLPEAHVVSSAGTVSGVTVQHNGMTGGLRVSFLFDPGTEVLADLRVDLKLPGARAEVWLYQWAIQQKPNGAL